MNKKAFTLMELLLVIAILAIVAVAGLPIFSSGQDEALKEAKKAAFLNAYQNTISGANMMMGILLINYSKSTKGVSDASYAQVGFLNPNLSLDALNQWRLHGDKKEPVNLNYYSPVLSRMFKDINGHQYFFSAKFGENQNIEVYYVDIDDNTQRGQTKDLGYYHGAAFDAAPKATIENGRVIDLSEGRTLDYYWKKINNLL